MFNVSDWRVGWMLAAAIAATAPQGTARAQSSDAAFLAGLRERRLFELADRHCLDRLASPQVDEPLRTELVVERIRTLATHGIHAPAERRAAIWQQARQVAAEFQRQSPSPQRVLLVRLQDALTPLAEGELGRQEFEAGALGAERLEPTRRILREAGDRLESIDKELSAQIPLRRRVPPRPFELTADELVSLQQQTRRHLARAYRNRGLLFDASSDDRLALVLRSEETLQASLSQLAGDEPLARTLQLDLALCQRLLGRHDEAEQLLAGLSVEGVEPPVRLLARAELIRLAVAQKNTAAAERLIEQGRTIEGQSAAELDFAWFEAYLALARAAGDGNDPPAARRYQDLAAETAKALEAVHGPYWGRRADQLLVASLPSGRGTVNVELLGRTADRLYLQRQFDQAIAAYDNGAGQARAAGDLNASFALSYKAALVEQGRQRHEAASRRFRTLSKGLATHPQAPAAHLAAAWHAAQLVQDDAAAAGEYAAILREHLAAWPADESTAQARLWLGRLLESQEQWSQAAEAYARVPRTSEHFAAAVAGLATSSRQHLAAISAAGEPVAEPADQAIQRLAGTIQGSDNRQDATWTDADRTATLAAAQLILIWQPSQAGQAERMLADALRGSPDAPALWKAAARAQLVVALSERPDRQDEALAVVRQVGAGSTDELLAVLTGLSRVAQRGGAESRGKVAAVQLAAVELLTPARPQLTHEGQQTLDLAGAEALAAAGRRAEALAAYKALAAANPESGAIQRGYAELLLAGDDKASLAVALAQWRIIASRSKAHTSHWHEAKYSVALAQLKLGDKVGAATLLRYHLEAPPGLAGSAWQPKFEALLRACSP